MGGEEREVIRPLSWWVGGWGWWMEGRVVGGEGVGVAKGILSSLSFFLIPSELKHRHHSHPQGR